MNSPLPAVQRNRAMSPSSQKCHRTKSQEAPGRGKCTKVYPLAQKLDTLASEFAEVKKLLFNLQPPDA